jgi:hypothetical protein
LDCEGATRREPCPRSPAASLFLLDLAAPYRYLELRGEAEITADDDLAFANRVGEKYHADLSLHDKPGDMRVVVTIRPSGSTRWTCAADYDGAGLDSALAAPAALGPAAAGSPCASAAAVPVAPPGSGVTGVPGSGSVLRRWV